ncbi:MAG TPA: DeoR/GlpR family DNA-binding transcription regulator, partial [Agromyces mariniharenae]|nr:DeoR/GlpR family DNA-binding transcription regulator [Agromyces mariniharenae]
MNRAERLSAVLDLLAEGGQVEVDQIVERLDVSPATARRDLDALAEQQLLTRTRGGAVAHSVAYDLPIRYKNQQNPEAKAAIARAASALVPRGAVIGLCGGTTATAIADALMSRADIMEPSHEPSLTVVTNAINIAMQLAMRPQIKTVVTGGVVHARSYELVGS